MTDFHFQQMFEMDPDEIRYRKLSSDYVSVGDFRGQSVLEIEGEASETRTTIRIFSGGDRDFEFEHSRVMESMITYSARIELSEDEE